ncbi:MAG TPA: glycoside hydrolase family 57 protein [Candidatus Saccharimonadales bacterium]|jgi:alpha-amylase|nr:glycoside hydrolase family 57 protein [Candidatus Saccharimonadales bacterium]
MSSRAIVLYLHVHQPYRVRQYSVFDSGVDHNYFTEADYEIGTNNERILRKVAEKSYIPTNRRLLELLYTYPEFKLSLSLTGTLLEQLERWAPEALLSFQELVATGRVEIIGETYHHSLAFFYSRFEFEKQVRMHREKIQTLFGVTPAVFRNTELAYNNDLAYWADEAGYKGILAEGWDPILTWRSPNFVYRPAYTNMIRLLMKNYHLSDDIAFRFGDKNWSQWPLTAEKFSGWINDLDTADVINLFMDYETFGEHQWKDSGIFDFLSHLPGEFLKTDGNTFMTVSEAIDAFPAVDAVDVPQTITWADTERDLTAWLGNRMQQEAMKLLYKLESDVLATGDREIVEDWRRLQTSDHAYYMCTKWFHDGDVHAYFSPYESPYDGFIYYMNVLRDLELRVMTRLEKGRY